MANEQIIIKMKVLNAGAWSNEKLLALKSKMKRLSYNKNP